MQKKYIISIPEPCNEKWDEMTPTEKGRFCAVCQTEIYDFTNLTHQELAEKLKRNENICAKYRPDQLDVDLYAQSDINLSKIAMAISLTTAVTLTQPATAQNTSTKTQTEQTDIQKAKETPADSTKITIKGIVRDKTDNSPLPGVNVIVKGTNQGVATDFNGLFSIDVMHKNNEPIVLVFSYVGFSQTEIVISDFEKPQDIKLVQIEMKEEVVTMGVVVVQKRNIFQRIGDWFKRTFSRKKKKEAKRSCEVKY